MDSALHLWVWIGIGIVLIFDSVMRFLLIVLRGVKRRAKSFDQSHRRVSPKGAVVLIACHNEAGVVGPTVKSLKAQLSEWPGTRVWVVADRCEDATAQEAAEAGANVAIRAGGPLGKSAVIAWWMNAYQETWRERDAVVVLDADSRLKKGSLRELGRAMIDPQIAAAQCLVAPVAETASGRLSGWSELLMQRIDDEARRRCGWSVPLRGAGMAFRGETLFEIAPRLHTLAEDLEMDVILAAAGQRVEFIPTAVVLDQKPRASAGASRQRARWFIGQGQTLWDYKREFLRALLLGGASAWMLLPLLMMRPKILLIGLRLLSILLSFFAPALYRIVITGLILDIVYYLAGAIYVTEKRRYLLDLLSAPRYAAMWFYSFGIVMTQQLFRRSHQVWLRAGRQSS